MADAALGKRKRTMTPVDHFSKQHHYYVLHLSGAVSVADYDFANCLLRTHNVDGTSNVQGVSYSWEVPAHIIGVSGGVAGDPLEDLTLLSDELLIEPLLSTVREQRLSVVTHMKPVCHKSTKTCFTLHPVERKLVVCKMNKSNEPMRFQLSPDLLALWKKSLSTAPAVVQEAPGVTTKPVATSASVGTVTAPAQTTPPLPTAHVEQDPEEEEQEAREAEQEVIEREEREHAHDEYVARRQFVQEEDWPQPKLKLVKQAAPKPKPPSTVYDQRTKTVTHF